MYIQNTLDMVVHLFLARLLDALLPGVHRALALCLRSHLFAGLLVCNAETVSMARHCTCPLLQLLQSSWWCGAGTVECYNTLMEGTTHRLAASP